MQVEPVSSSNVMRVHGQSWQICNESSFGWQSNSGVSCPSLYAFWRGTNGTTRRDVDGTRRRAQGNRVSFLQAAPWRAEEDRRRRQQQVQHVPVQQAPSEAQQLNTILLTHLRRRRQRQYGPHLPVEVPEILQGAAETISKIWAASTWSQRASLWNRLQNFVDQENITHWPVGMQATAFIAAQDVAIQTKYTYGKTLAALARRFGHTVPMLDVYIAGLVAAGATSPTKQAVPASQQQVEFLVRHLLQLENFKMATAVYLVWKLQ